MRKPIFDIIRAQRGKGFTAEEVAAIDTLLNSLGIEQDGATAPIASHPPPASASTAGLDNPERFFDTVRESDVLGGALKPDQVMGLHAVLGAAREAGWPLAFTAYALATACHETNSTMQPVREAYWLSENWRRNNLRRYYPYFGRGYVQLTWKANYERADRELELGGRLNDNLDLALDPNIAARIMVRGMQEGWFCADRSGQRHTLVRHLPANGIASSSQFTSARRIINGTDKAGKIAGEAAKFQEALRAGGW
jgi:putative chitinase